MFKQLTTNLTAAGLLASLACGTSAGVVYLEDFNEGSGTRTLSDFGLTGVSNTGTDISSSTGFNSGAVYTSSSLEGDGYASLSGDFVFMDAPALSAITQVRWLDTTADLGYRLALEVGGSWYLSASIATSTAGGFSMDTTANGGNPVPNGDPSAADGPFPGITITDFSSGFSLWSDDPSDGYDTTFTGTLGAAGALPSGNITRIGLLAGSGSNRPDYFEVSGTVVPEPGSLALLGLGGLLIGARRRRNA